MQGNQGKLERYSGLRVPRQEFFSECEGRRRGKKEVEQVGDLGE